MKVSKSEYLKALEIIDTYHHERDKDEDVQKTKIKDWLKMHAYSDPCISVRLYNILAYMESREQCKYIEDINNYTFKLNYGSGKKSWKEFVELRGY